MVYSLIYLRYYWIKESDVGLLLLRYICPLLLIACHNTQRDNPLDPQLTPAVELSVVLEDTAATAVLSWSPYQGEPLFAEYQVLRNIADRVSVDTLATFTDIGTLTFRDTTLATNATYAYRVGIRNSAGFAVSSTPVLVGPLHLTTIGQLRATFDSGTASAALVWSPYRGPRFSAYQVLRRSGDTERIVAELDAVDDTTFVDASLDGATNYTYQVTVRSERGEIVEGATAHGSIHAFLTEWPLGIIPDAVLDNFGYLDANTFPRIYIAGDEIRVMGSDFNGAYLLRFDKEGLLLSSQWLASTEEELVDMAQSGDGRLWFLVPGATTIALLSTEPDGQLRKRSHDLFTDALATPFTGDQAVVLEQIALVGAFQRDGTLNIPYINAANLTVTRDGSVLYRDFNAETETLDAGWTLEQSDDALNVYRLGTSPFPWGGTYPSYLGRLFWTGSSGESLHRLGRDGDGWSDFALQADLISHGNSRGGIAIGGDTFSRFTLSLSKQNQAQFNWTYVPVDGSARSEENYSQSFPFRGNINYRLYLEAIQGRVRARVETPLWWTSPAFAASQRKSFGMADLGDSFAISVNNLAYYVTIEGEGEFIDELPDMVNYLKTWERDGRRFLGAIMPESGRIVWGPVVGVLAGNWPSLLRRSFGPFLSDGDGSLRYPIAFAVGPDGRFYILDGANYRVVVFDEQGEYITQWGTRGNGPGQFNLGSGEERTDTFVFKSLSGDITVDDEGFVYVVDHDNLRVQKFAP